MKKIAKTIKKSYTKNEKSSEILNKKFEKIIWKTKKFEKLSEKPKIIKKSKKSGCVFSRAIYHSKNTIGQIKDEFR